MYGDFVCWLLVLVVCVLVCGVCCLVCDVRCAVFVVCRLLFVVGCLSFAQRWLLSFVFFLSCVVRCFFLCRVLWCVLLFVVCVVRLVVCCWLHVVRCKLWYSSFDVGRRLVLFDV